MAITDIFVLDLCQTFNSEELHNIFTYEASEPTAAINLITVFEDDVLPALNVLQATGILNKFIKAYALGTDLDLDERVIAGGGSVGGDMLPVFNALNYTLKPVGRGVRPGSKRFAGIPESAQESGTVTLAGYITAMEGLRVALSTVLLSGATLSFYPVVVKRVKYAPNPVEFPDKFAYRFPETDLELDARRLRAVLSNVKISHQTSRGN